MTDNVFAVNNPLARSNDEKFYLDSNSADVKFVFGVGTDHVETVPAHKFALSIASPAFETMFYGSLPEQGDVPINDASAAAFKEFLQFFYLTTVRLTSQHIFEVSNLCKKYEVAEALELCEDPLHKSLTIDDMCAGYALAILLDLTNTTEFCELKILANVQDILKSTSFSECNHEMFDKIIQGVAPYCTASAIVEACMTWAEAACGRKNLDKTAANLKDQLGQTFSNIPFAELNEAQFEQFVGTYNGFLDSSDLTAIVLKVMNKSEAERRAARKLICDRRGPNIDQFAFSRPFNSDSTIFKANQSLWLTEIRCTRLIHGFSMVLSAEIYSEASDVPLAIIRLSASHSTEGHAVLEQPFLIDANVRYDLEFIADDNSQSIPWEPKHLKKVVEMRDGYTINFMNRGSVAQFVFMKSVD